MNQGAAHVVLPPDDRDIEQATKSAVATMREFYGNDLLGAYLFRSRARGDYHACSNVNVAGVVENHRLAGSRCLRFSDLRYDVLIETGADLDIEVLSKSEWLEPSRSERASRVPEIRRDAIDLLTEFWEEKSEESP